MKSATSKVLVRVALVSCLLAGRAVAQTPYEPTDAAVPSATVDSVAPSVTPPPAVVIAPAPPLVTAAPPPTIAPAPPAPPPAPTVSFGPGDEEAKADFQQARVLPDDSPLTWRGRHGSLGLYGFAELDYLRDSTESFGSFANNFTLARPRTITGDDPRTQVSPCDSRLGLRASTSAESRLRGIFLLELGPVYRPDETSASSCRRGARHLLVGLRTPIVDVLLGRYYALFGWGGKGFLPNTAAFMGVPGQLYHLESQLRVSHIFRFEPVDFEVAAALASSPQSESGTGEGHFALRLAVNRWRGASAQASGPPEAAPLQVGVSGVRRALKVNDFQAVAAPPLTAVGQGLSLDAFLPLIPADGDDLGNSVSLTLEISSGSGLADMYTGLTGGLLFPVLPNPTNVLPAPVYTPNLDPGIATFDAAGNLRLVEWHAVVLGAQYHFPFERGRRVWVSLLYTRLRSDNALQLTPVQGQAFVWADGSYADLDVFVALGRGFQLALSGQVTRQTFGDGTVADNARTQLAATYFF